MIRTLFIVFLMWGAAAAGTVPQTAPMQTIEITIDYGSLRPARTVAVTYAAGSTALDVLGKAAKVRTKQAGRFIFITAIDGIRSVPQSMGWFYSVDGLSADKTAAANILQNAKTMRWEYRPDHCLAQ